MPGRVRKKLRFFSSWRVRHKSKGRYARSLDRIAASRRSLHGRARNLPRCPPATIHCGRNATKKKDVPGTDEKELRRVAKPLVFSFPLAGGRLPVPLFPPTSCRQQQGGMTNKNDFLLWRSTLLNLILLGKTIRFSLPDEPRKRQETSRRKERQVHYL